MGPGDPLKPAKIQHDMVLLQTLTTIKCLHTYSQPECRGKGHDYIAQNMSL